MKKQRQQVILEIIGEREVGTQQDLAGELEARGIEATQSSVSRDIRELGLVKVSGHYAAPGPETFADGPILKIDTAGDNLIVVRTGVGQAQLAAVKIDSSDFPEVVGTVAGDDTIIIATKNAAAQRVAIKKIAQLFVPRQAPGRRRRSKRAGIGDRLQGIGKES